MMPHLDSELRLAEDGPGQLGQACLDHGVQDQRVLAAFQTVRRADFVPAEWMDQAYRDRPVPIPHGQVTTQPSLVAQMVAALKLRGTERVLEVGTGLGFQTAILAELSDQVFSIERFPDLAASARRNLRAAGTRNVQLTVDDGTLGWPEAAPFDAIVVSAAAPRVPPPFVEQLTEGGRITHPAGSGGDEMVTLYRKKGGRLILEAPITPAHFVRLVGMHGLSEDP